MRVQFKPIQNSIIKHISKSKYCSVHKFKSGDKHTQQISYIRISVPSSFPVVLAQKMRFLFYPYVSNMLHLLTLFKDSSLKVHHSFRKIIWHGWHRQSLGDLMLASNFKSSAYMAVSQQIMSVTSLTDKRNSSGPRLEPCRTPEVPIYDLDLCSWPCTKYLPFAEQEARNAANEALNPQVPRIVSNSLSSVRSKAFETSV